MSGKIFDRKHSKIRPKSSHLNSSNNEQERTSLESPSSKVTPVRQDGSKSGDHSLKFREKRREPMLEGESPKLEVATAQDDSRPKKTNVQPRLKFRGLEFYKRNGETTSEGKDFSPTGVKGNSLVLGRTATDQNDAKSNSYFNRIRAKFKPGTLFFNRKKQPLGENLDSKTTIGGGKDGSTAGAFNNARNMVIDNAIMWEGAQFHQTVHNTIVTQTAVLQNLVSRSCPYVAVDSGARYPPPKCHPGTRRQILDQLESWMDNSHREQKMIWVKGLAGIGKSAIIQTFAEKCLERNRLGASFFFKREWQIDPSNLIPTIACQLTIYIPEYQQLLFDRLSNDPSILDKAPRVQFTNLIIELISVLQSQGHKINQEPPVIILDGLEECRGTDAQSDIVEMISEAVRAKESLPLLWLISSQPLEYLKYAFLKCNTPSSSSWGEVQVDSADEDVQAYLRDHFNDINERLADFIKPPWPSDEQVKLISNMTSGFFALATAIVRYVDDSKRLHPMERLTEVETLLRNCGHTDTTTLLQLLDQLNTCLQSESTLSFE